jgi:DNA-binding beta-propeller fold protein YncE
VPLLVTSAAGVNGDGYGALLAFDRHGRPLGAFSNDARIGDPRGLAVDQEKELLFLNSGSDRVLALDRNGKVVRDTGPIPQLNPGGGTFGPDGRYYIGLRSARTIMALSATLEDAGERILPPGVLPFPRGFAFSGDGTLFLSSGIGPNGEGDNAIVAFAQGQNLKPLRLISDPELSPLDLAMAPNGNIVVSSEHPFGLSDAVTSVREYGAVDGHSSASSQPVDRRGSADPAVCASVPTALSTASPEMRSWPSISRAVDALAPSYDSRG